METETYIMIYENKSPNILIFGKEFVRYYRNKFKFIFKNKKYRLKNTLETKNIRENKIKLKLILDKYIYNRNYMFKNCETLKELRNKNENNNSDENNNNTKQIIYEINEQYNENKFIYYNDLFDDIDESNQTFKFDTSASYGTDNNTNFPELRNYDVEKYEFTIMYRENISNRRCKYDKLN